ncbi:hypothetical protein PWT90_10174 [Aphanocladium album]|nr:hypothetical protein PWT90_10174 [Aphanocladium album]
MPQPSAEWLAHSAFVPHWHQSGPSMSSANPAFTYSYAPSQNGPYSAANIPGAHLSNTANQYHLPAGAWPPTSLPHQPSAPQTGHFGLITTPNAHQPHHIARGSAAAPVIAHSQHPFAQHFAAAAHRGLLPGTVNPQLNANARVNQQSQTSASYSAEASPFTLHARHVNQPYQPLHRSTQSRSRPSQTHQRTQSTPALNQSVGDRMSQPSFSERRRLEHMRGRRSISTRFSASESSADPTRSMNGSVLLYPGARRQATMNHTGALEEAETRRLQLLRGALQSRYVVSKAALQSLQAVDVKDLAESDRTCMICYNDYETASPEGICERPIRLPKCKHVFGNHCIRKWFQDSDSCPYCRDKLQSEPKHYPSSTRAFLDMMRIRGWTAGSEVAEDFYRRIMNGEDVRAIVSVSRSSGERRPAQGEESDELPRRARQRRSSSSSVEEEVPSSPLRSPEGAARGAARPRTTPNSSGPVSPA